MKELNKTEKNSGNSEIFYVSKLNDKSEYTVFLLHGYGSNEHQMLSYFSLWPEKYSLISIRGFEFFEQSIYDDKKIKHNEANSYPRQWFSLLNDEDIVKDLRFSSKKIAEFIDCFIKDNKILPEKIIVVGFSQGGYVSMLISEWLDYKIACIVCMEAGVKRFNEADLLSINFKLKQKQKYCLIHGLDDNVVDHSCSERAKNILEKIGCDVSLFKIKGLSHKVHGNAYKMIEEILVK